ncbi:hypothetical protein DFH27DRAFT_534925 [Peziza echinospora]|nr:hypothetical protein DFH27DRAFT_534925 [Peziza echinospora]
MKGPTFLPTTTPQPQPPSSPPPYTKISTHKWFIAGIEVSVHGLEQLEETLIEQQYSSSESQSPRSSLELHTIYGLHPRGQDEAYMHPTVKTCVWDNYFYFPPTDSESPSQKKRREKKKKYVLGITFDHRNHGHRTYNPIANTSFRERAEAVLVVGVGGVGNTSINTTTTTTSLTAREGEGEGGVINPNHAIDMFTIYHGTYVDYLTISGVLTSYLSIYFSHQPNSQKFSSISWNQKAILMGVSLGAHSAYLALFGGAEGDSATTKNGDNEVQVLAVASVIGCADYTTLMRWRLLRQRMLPSPSTTSTTLTPTPTEFTTRTDPILPGEDAFLPSSFVQRVLRRWDPAMLLQNQNKNQNPGTADSPSSRPKKKLLVLTGGNDRLVPPEFSVGVVRELEERHGVEVRRVQWEEVGHEYTEEMGGEVRRFVRGVLED